jgi:branched-chain amino acid transport system ATP-binding protein
VAILEICGLDVDYDRVRAVHALSLEVAAGEIVALIGGNGAGKSTTLNAISGLVRARNGTIRFLGQDITHVEPHRIVEAGLLQVPEGRRVFSTLTVEENLDMGAFARVDRSGIDRDKQDMFTRFPTLSERRRQLAGTCSGGEQQMLAIGRALMARPKLLMLDEPSLGLAPMIVRSIFRIIRELNRDRGMSILLVEQNARMALRLAHRATVLDRGKTRLSGNSAALLADPAVQHAFLGKASAAMPPAFTPGQPDSAVPGSGLNA